jgi:hypothetical protein
MNNFYYLGNGNMLYLHKLVIERFVKELERAYQHTYSIMEPNVCGMVSWSGRLALENIANCDALYHNLDHTVMVALVGQTILEGKHLIEGGVTPKDWLHYMTALLCHDIGFVKGICRADDPDANLFATGIGDELVEMPPGSTSAILAPYHVDRSKLFIKERFSGSLLAHIDAELVASFIEMTRFPVPNDPEHQATNNYAGLVRAADFIGQLGDPNYLRKIPALFYEFEETGANKVMGYHTPGDMRRRYAQFYWNEISPYIQDAMRYLRVTQEGKQWIVNLHAHVFDVEHDLI